MASSTEANINPDAEIHRGPYLSESIPAKGAASVGVESMGLARVESQPKVCWTKIVRTPSKLAVKVWASITPYIVARILGLPKRMSSVGVLLYHTGARLTREVKWKIWIRMPKYSDWTSLGKKRERRMLNPRLSGREVQKPPTEDGERDTDTAELNGTKASDRSTKQRRELVNIRFKPNVEKNIDDDGLLSKLSATPKRASQPTARYSFTMAKTQTLSSTSEGRSGDHSITDALLKEVDRSTAKRSPKQVKKEPTHSSWSPPEE